MQSLFHWFTPYALPHLVLLPLTHIPGHYREPRITFGYRGQAVDSNASQIEDPRRTSGNSDPDEPKNLEHSAYC